MRSSAMLSIEEAVTERLRQPAETLGAMTLAEYVSRAELTSGQADAEVCLFFDQFEELFVLDPVDVGEKAAFFEQLGVLLRDRNIWTLIAMREDFLAQLDPYLGVFPRRLATRIRLDFLGSAPRDLQYAIPPLACGCDSLTRPLRSWSPIYERST